MTVPSEDKLTRHAPWLHLILLLLVVSTLIAGRMMLSPDGAFVASVFTRALYDWLPALAGIAISITAGAGPTTRTGLLVSLAVVALMVVLDYWGGANLGAPQTQALFPNASIQALTQASRLASVSWVDTAWHWLKGDLTAASQMSDDYGLDDPRLRVAYAVTEASLTLVVFSCVGFVIGAMSWTRTHVIFRSSHESKAFLIALAWLIAPLVVEVSRRLAVDQRFQVLFRGASIWRPAIPHLVVLIGGVLAWRLTARYRETDDA